MDSLDDIKLKVKNYIYKAQYKKAEQYLLLQQKHDPRNVFILSKLATLPAEEAFNKSDEVMQKAFKKAATRLKVLLTRYPAKDKELRYRNYNEYYWFSQQHLKQYQLGYRNVKGKDVIGYYSMGVGAANHAYKLKLKNKNKLSLQWAKKAEQAWLNYFEFRTKTYHDPWLWYGLSLGLQGRYKEMEKALKTSAKLAKRPLQHPTFKKIRRMATYEF